MLKENIIQLKSFDFAKEIIFFYKKNDQRDPVIKQLLRSGTSIGANVEEALGGVSKKDFILKLGISYKEARESLYWIKLLKETSHPNIEAVAKLETNCGELIKILGAIIKTSKESSNS